MLHILALQSNERPMLNNNEHLCEQAGIIIYANLVTSMMLQSLVGWHETSNNISRYSVVSKWINTAL